MGETDARNVRVEFMSILIGDESVIGVTEPSFSNQMKNIVTVVHVLTTGTSVTT